MKVKFTDDKIRVYCTHPLHFSGYAVFVNNGEVVIGKYLYETCKFPRGKGIMVNVYVFERTEPPEDNLIYPLCHEFEIKYESKIYA